MDAGIKNTDKPTTNLITKGKIIKSVTAWVWIKAAAASIVKNYNPLTRKCILTMCHDWEKIMTYFF